jgi:Glycosyl hydrolase family 67 N-terminus.
MKKIISLIACFICFSYSYSQNFITEKNEPNSFPIVSSGIATKIYVDNNEEVVVQKAAAFLQSDIEKVTGKRPEIIHSISPAKNIIIIGTLKTPAIAGFDNFKKINTDLKGKWETFKLQTVSHPTKQIDNALLIVGSDKRGAAFGVFELSKQIGVSPWYWWADVPVEKKTELFVQKNIDLQEQPSVKYRGIFINDEAPALSGWSKEKFGGFNHEFYEKVFELMLRLKANYLWPAMWGNAFYDDDTLNKKTAEEYGIVIGTSHHEPLMRAHDEWRRYGKGKWNYDSNQVRLKEFWKAGMQRATNEKIVSIGMRGDGDEPMTEGTAIELLERIVKDQRKIIEDVTQTCITNAPALGFI